jgi:hypothetical protein
MDRDAKAEIDRSVEEAKASPPPELKDLWTDIYYKGTEPEFMRGREREEVGSFFILDVTVTDVWFADSSLLDSFFL